MATVYADIDATLRECLRESLKAPPLLTVAEWAAQNFYLDDTTSAEPGLYDPTRTPYVVEPMECLSVGSPIQRVILKWGSQTGKSTVGNAWIGYVIANSPGPMLVVQPRTQDALDYSRLRIEPMITASPQLDAKIGSKLKRDGGNTLLTKTFPGGVLLVTGANSAAGLKSRPVRYLFLDEVDEYPLDVEGQGDPVGLAIRRTNTFGPRRKVLETSTPTIAGRSRVDLDFEQTDKRHFHVPCPHCGTRQELVFERLKWPKHEPHRAHYVCANCEKAFEEVTKREWLPEGQWVPHGEPGLVAGFHLPSWYSPLGWLSWAEIATEWVEAQGDDQALKQFVNTVMAETWESRGDAPPWQTLFDRREDFARMECPPGVVFLTAGVDVQKDRLEAYVWGWGYRKESWLVDHIIYWGDPWNPETWHGLTELLHQGFDGPNGDELHIGGMAVDTGFAQEPVIAWARSVADPRVMLVKGDHWKNWKVMLGSPSKSDVTLRGRRTGLLLWPVGGALIKAETYGFIRQDPPEDGQPYPPGWIHLPRWVDQEICKQITAEDLVETTDTKGFTKREFVKHRHRNEGLDCRVYARAVAERMGLSRMKLEEESPGPRKTEIEREKPERADWLKRHRGGGDRRKPWI